MDQLQPVVFTDAWGSTVSIASLQGRPIPSEEPESELWMGAHEAGPAVLCRAGEPTLPEVIAADPEGELGAACIARFGARLPFLLKVLAAGKAISIQAHPSAERARQVRTEMGSDDVYVDDFAKPEMLVAIAPFEIFVGMRSHAQVRRTAELLAVPRLLDLVDATASAADPAHALLAAVLEVPADQRTGLVREVVAACVRLESSPDAEGHACATIVRVAEEHPDDIGIVVLILMHHRVLEPGEYIDVPPGVLHSYVKGLGIEVLASSDNVVRAGLTTKPVNVPELLRIVDSAASGAAGRPLIREGGVETFTSHTDRFRLHRILRADPTRLPGDGGPRIAFCLRGNASLVGGGLRVDLGAAESVFISARERDVVCSGAGELYVVTLGD